MFFNYLYNLKILKMKNLLIFGLFIMALIMVQYTQAQTVDDVIEKYVTAMGGKEKMMTLTTVKMTGSFNVQGTDVSIVSTRKHMAGMRLDISVMGTENYQVMTATKGMIFMPIQGQTAPEEMPEDVFKTGQNQLDLQGAFLNYKEKGTAIEMTGKETVDGTECYKLKVTFKNGNKTDYFIDTKSNRIFKTSTKIMANGEEMDAFTTFSNYKQVDGFWFAFTNVSARGETNYEKIEVNIPVDDAIFKAN